MTTNLNPEFVDLGNPETYNKHMSDLTNGQTIVAHERLLVKLLEQVEPVDYLLEAYPEAAELIKQLEECDPTSHQTKNLHSRLKEFKLHTKHFLVITIESLMRCAEKNNWGLCRNNDMIYLYNGAYWSKVEDAQFQKFLGDAAEKMGIEKYSAKLYSFQEKLLKQFFASSYFETVDPSNDAVCINLMNGTYEIQNGKGKLRGFDQKDFLTYQLPFDFDPNAEAPIFNNFLTEVLPDEASRKVLSEYAGYIFVKNGSKAIKIEKVLMLLGSGANGKSVIFEVLNAVLGTENVVNHPLHLLTNENGYYRADLAGKLVNYASEINGRMDPAMFKRMASGEPIDARLPYGKPLTIRQYAKFIFNSNELPWQKELTDAYFRRFLIIPFPVTIPEERQDKNLHTKIIENELSGVFNWMLEGLKRLIEQKGFTPCPASEEALKKYEEESDSVIQFLQEYGYEKSAEKFILYTRLYESYKYYCAKDDNCRPLKKSRFKARLESLGFHMQQGSGNNNVFYMESNICDE